jgi:hypothetical protein
MNTLRSISLSITPFVLGLFTLPASGCQGQGDALDGEHVDEASLWLMGDASGEGPGPGSGSTGSGGGTGGSGGMGGAGGAGGSGGGTGGSGGMAGQVLLMSWKGDYLHRPDSAQGVTTWHTGIGNEWTIEKVSEDKIRLKSWKGDYLHRPDSAQGVTTWHTGIGNEWKLFKK